MSPDDIAAFITTSIEQRIKAVQAQVQALEQEKARVEKDLARCQETCSAERLDASNGRQRIVELQAEVATKTKSLNSWIDQANKLQASNNDFRKEQAQLLQEAGSLKNTVELLKKQADAWKEAHDSIGASLLEAQKEIKYLRQYGNKECTAMADEARAQNAMDDPAIKTAIDPPSRIPPVMGLRVSPNYWVDPSELVSRLLAVEEMIVRMARSTTIYKDGMNCTYVDLFSPEIRESATAMVHQAEKRAKKMAEKVKT